MPPLDSIFAKGQKGYEHPLLRYLDSTPSDRVRVEVVRPKDVLGYKSATIYIHRSVNGVEQPPQPYPWEPELNAELVRRKIASVTPDAEAVRFALSLRDHLKRPETRFGDGFFNAVLLLVVKELGFAEFPDVAAVLKHVTQSRPHMGGHGYDDCREMIVSIVSDRANELVGGLGYPEADAKTILASAMARYLDERFTVTDRIRLGWVAS
jgi:hypothetical protein